MPTIALQPASPAASEEVSTSSPWTVRYALVLVLSALVFAGVLGGEMVWDDRMLTDGSAIGGGTSLLNCFTHPFLWHFFRPLVSVSFFFERMLWHGDPLGYHITNLLLHVAGTAVIIRAMYEAFRSHWTALLGGAFFGIHPVQVGAVAWIGGRTDSLSSLWVILMLLMLVRSARARASEASAPLAYAVLFFNLAIYTKEQCLPLLLLAPLAYLVWAPASGVRLPRTAFFATIPFAISVVAFLTAGLFLGMPRPGHIGYGPAGIALLAGNTIAYYALLLAAPTPALMHRLSVEGFGSGPWMALFGYLVLAAAGAVLLRWRRRDRPAAWFLALALLAMAPISNLIPLPFLVVAPYRAALPWIGLAAVLGHAFGSIVDSSTGVPRQARRFTTIAVAAGCLLVWQGLLTAWGSLQWRSETRVFSQIIAHDPGSIVAKTVYTYSLEREKRYREAAEVEEAALRQVFGSDAWRESETAHRAMESDPQIFFRARRNQGTNEDPRIWIAGLYAQLARCRTQQGDHAAALHALAIGDRIWSNHLQVHLGMGYYAAQRGDYTEAARRYQMALAINQDNAAAHAGLAYALSGEGRWAEAADEYARAARLDPDNADTKSRLERARLRARSGAAR